MNITKGPISFKGQHKIILEGQPDLMTQLRISNLLKEQGAAPASIKITTDMPLGIRGLFYGIRTFIEFNCPNDLDERFKTIFENTPNFSKHIKKYTIKKNKETPKTPNLAKTEQNDTKGRVLEAQKDPSGTYEVK